MSTRAVAYVEDRLRHLRPTEFQVCCALAEAMPEGAETVTIASAELSYRARVSRRCLWNCLTRLEAQGIVKREKRFYRQTKGKLPALFYFPQWRVPRLLEVQAQTQRLRAVAQRQREVAKRQLEMIQRQREKVQRLYTTLGARPDRTG